jgi:hypothetical protein
MREGGSESEAVMDEIAQYGQIRGRVPRFGRGGKNLQPQNAAIEDGYGLGRRRQTDKE